MQYNPWLIGIDGVGSDQEHQRRARAARERSQGLSPSEQMLSVPHANTTLSTIDATKPSRSDFQGDKAVDDSKNQVSSDF